MRCNVSRIDVNVRWIVALLLSGVAAFLLVLGLLVLGGLALVLSVYLFATAAMRFAPEYLPFHFETKDRRRGPIRR